MLTIRIRFRTQSAVVSARFRVLTMRECTPNFAFLKMHNVSCTCAWWRSCKCCSLCDFELSFVILATATKALYNSYLLCECYAFGWELQRLFLKVSVRKISKIENFECCTTLNKNGIDDETYRARNGVHMWKRTSTSRAYTEKSSLQKSWSMTNAGSEFRPSKALLACASCRLIIMCFIYGWLIVLLRQKGLGVHGFFWSKVSFSNLATSEISNESLL